MGDLNEGAGAANPSPLGDAEGRLLFTVWPEGTGKRVWATDGTAEGTHALARLDADAALGNVRAWPSLGGRRIIVTLGVEEALWITDGTDEGTIRLGSFHDTDGFGVRSPVRFRGDLFFSAADDAHGRELWRTDGTPNGTWVVRDILVGPGSSFSWSTRLVRAGGRLLFAADDGTHGIEPWASDGTGAGTLLLRDTWPGDDQTLDSVGAMERLGDRVVFAAEDATSGVEPWTSDGTPGGTRRLRDVRPGGRSSGIQHLTAAAGGELFFSADTLPFSSMQLWRSDGTRSGTGPLVALGSNFLGDLGSGFTPVGSSLYFFFADQSDNQLYLLVSDGTREGTRRVRGWSDTSYTSCREGVAWRERFYTGCWSDPLFDVGRSGGLLRSDGTRATRYLLELRSPTGPVDTVGVTDPVVVGNRLYFLVQRVQLGSRPRRLDPSGLWRTDGTRAGTSRVVDLRLGVGASGHRSDRRLLVGLGRRLFVAARDQAHGLELWTSDGSRSGTSRLVDLRPGVQGSHPRHLSVAGDRLFFDAVDGVHGREPWVSDGTAGGTRLVLDIRRGQRGSDPSRVIEAGGYFYFTADDGMHGRELWISDGTPSGTVLVRDIVAGRKTSSPAALTAVGPLVFFRAADIAGAEMWRTDGTRSGTQRVADLLPGPAGSRPAQLTAMWGSLYFVADDGARGRELWRISVTPDR